MQKGKIWKRLVVFFSMLILLVGILMPTDKADASSTNGLSKTSKYPLFIPLNQHREFNIKIIISAICAALMAVLIFQISKETQILVCSLVCIL